MSGDCQRPGRDPSATLAVEFSAKRSAELDSITPLALALAAYPKAVLLGAASTLVMKKRLAPRWIEWAGYGLALLGLASTATIAVRALFPLVSLQLLLFPLWVLALAAMLLVRSRSAGVVAPASLGEPNGSTPR